MSIGRQRCLWEHTSVLQAQIINLLREKPISPAQLNPFSATRRSNGHPLDRATLGRLRGMLRKRNAGR